MSFKVHIYHLIITLFIIMAGSLFNSGKLYSNVIVDVVTSNVSCYGGNDGSIELNISGGESPYTIEWSYNSIPLVGSNELLFLQAGTYYFTVTDALSETFSDFYVMLEPTPLTIGGQIEDISCYGNNDGSAQAQASGGTNPYLYRLYVNFSTYTPWQSASLFDNLVPGTYSIEVMDADSCISVYPEFEINEPSLLQIPFEVVDDISCYGMSDGSIEVLIVGGTSLSQSAPVYIIDWDNGANITSISGLQAGQYCVTATDANGCQADACYAIIEPGELTVNWLTNDVSCSGSNNGSINLDVQGGTLPIAFEWISNGFYSATEDITNLGPENYCVTVTDASGCTFSFCDDITEPNPLTILGSVDHISCFGYNDGSVEAQATGGTPDTAAGPGFEYQYRLYTNFTGIYTAWQFNSLFTGLGPGFYSLEVIDYNGCISVYPDFQIIEPVAVGISNYSLSDVSCFGFGDGQINIVITGDYFPYAQWSSGNTGDLLQNLDTGIYCVTLTDIKGCNFDTCFTISQPDILNISLSDTDVVCHGIYDAFIDADISGGLQPYSYMWSKNGVNYSMNEDLMLIGPGEYCLELVDYNGCVFSICDTITEPPPLTVSGQIEDISCFNGICDGSIEALVSGGSPGSDFGLAWDYEYRLQNASGQYIGWQYDSLFSGLCTDEYVLEVSDFYGCVSNYPPFVVGQPDQFLITANITNETCLECGDGIIDISISNGMLPYYFIWSNGETTEDISQLMPGEYTVSITDFNGCEGTASFFVESIPNPGWTVNESLLIHTILFDDTTSGFIDCSPLVLGDFIGVFYDSLGSLACAGYFMWTGDSTLMEVYGDDTLLVGKTGFFENEIFQWKAWRAVDSLLFDLTISYFAGDPLYPDNNQFVIDGASKVENILSIEEQLLALPYGWSYYSLNTDPLNPNLVDIFAPVVTNVLILKNGNGLMYWPAYSLNLIGNNTIGEGYQISMYNADTLFVEGTCLWPEQNPIVILEGWSILGYLRRSPAPVDQLLAAISSNVIIVKNELGAAYWPFFNLNLIGDMLPGKGYQIKLNTTSTLTYPSNDTIFINNVVYPSD